MPRLLDLPTADPAGLRADADLPYPLPYHLRAQDVLRMVEDLYELLHDLNVQLDAKGYDPLEELHDRAGFSGFVSRSVVNGIAKFSRALVMNRYHNGYPDLLPRNTYAGDSERHGELGGLEVKASRNDGSWQSHGPRGGWFCVVQFSIDTDEAKAVRDREPTTVCGVYIAELTRDDWSWQPAAAGRIRSGTASIMPSGRLKLRDNAVWVDPSYEDRHEHLRAELRIVLFRPLAKALIVSYLGVLNGPTRLSELVDYLAADQEIAEPRRIAAAISAALRSLVLEGVVARNGRGTAATYTITSTG